MRPAIRLVLVLLAAVGVSAPAFAHAMKAVVAVTADAVRVTVTYDSDDDHGGPVTVKLLDDQKRVVGEAKPDKDGVCTFPRPAAGRYRVVAADEFGHRATRDVEVKGDTETTVSAPPDRSRGLMIAVGLGVIAVLTLAGYWIAGRKKG